MAKKKSRSGRKRKGSKGLSKLKRWGKRLGILAFMAALGFGFVQIMGLIYPEQPGFAVSRQAAAHMPRCTPDHNSRPPTSGCHSPSQAAYGIHEDPIPAELQVHNLEHGAVMIQYRTSGLVIGAEELADRLESLVRRLRERDLGRYCRLIVAPYPYGFSAPGLSSEESEGKRIALTAWGRMQLLEKYEEHKAEAFIDAFINGGPENVDDCSI